jgi:2,4-dienoyl-CoA reductase-like NADH-dependent reductase (Old Yellow Enzyme family)
LRHSAQLAIEAGFSVIQVHAAHGYLLSLLLNPDVNQRTDRFQFGGPWFHGLVEDTKSVLGENLLSVRLNAMVGISPSEVEYALFRQIAADVISAGADIIDVSAGLYTLDRRLIYPNRGDGPLPHFGIARRLLAEAQCLVAIAGNISGLEDMPSDLPDRLLINVGRSLIADARFAQKLRDGRGSTVTCCRRTGRCHYFSRGEKSLTCGSNPAI